MLAPSSTWLNVLIIAIISTSTHSTVLASEEGADEPSTASEIYGQGVRETPRRNPSEEQQGFHLPQGFEIQLVAAEPSISKPLNMAFDSRGRLWVTNTVEYPYPASEEQPGRDSIRILEDTDGDGTADKFTIFADQLNIPIGILPVHDGAICFSIPYIWYLRDTDGDDVCDERIKILGPFDTSRDTHGMVNALRRGLDGWIYACHGFNNQSEVTAKDGSHVRLVSGNTFRFREDGSRVEEFTQGQVNPFGMTRDEWGNWYTADCHSKPISMLLHRGCYPSFGRQHDGLGFVPDMMTHSHGSTAICGIVFYTDSNFPLHFRHRFYSGNVMTSRINSNGIQRAGATVHAIEKPDLLTSDDPWFRPVDLQLGPDGSLYVADFYNKIIGHYEVPLTHPERDRDSGRIWRIVWRGDISDTSNTSRRVNSSKISQAMPEPFSEPFFEQLGSHYSTVRQQALDRLSTTPLNDTHVEALRERLADPTANEAQRVASLWGLHRAKRLDAPSLIGTLQSASTQLQAAALRSLADQSAESSELRDVVRKLLSSPEAQVRLAAAEALSAIGDATDIRRLLMTRQTVNKTDPVLRHALNLAAKTLLARESFLEQVLPDRPAANFSANPGEESSLQLKVANAKIKIDDPLALDVARILLAIPSERAAEGLLTILTHHQELQRELLDPSVEYLCRNLPISAIEQLVSLVQESSPSDLPRQIDLMSRVSAAFRTHGKPIPKVLKVHASGIAVQQFDRLSNQLRNVSTSIDWHETKGKIWLTEVRQCKRGPDDTLFFSSLSLGEKYTGVMSTSPFEAPANLSFWLAGHNGRPTSGDPEKNLVRLVDALDGSTLRTVAVPRHDIARNIDWDLREIQGRNVRLECVDDDNRNAYAWIAIGGFSEPRLNPDPTTKAIDDLSKLIRLRLIAEPKKLIFDFLSSVKLSRALQLRLMSAAAEGSGESALALLISLAERHRSELITLDVLSTNFNGQRESELAKQLVQHLTVDQQSAFARSMLSDPRGRSLLVELLREGTLSLAAMRDKKELLPPRQDDETAKALFEVIQKADLLPDQKNAMLEHRMASLTLIDADVELGRFVFEKQCAVCHQLSGRGQTVGPQLDGIGARGVQRLAEDILMPNRNVDRAFQVSTMLLDDDKVVSGLLREQSDGTLNLTGSDGKTIQIDADSIVEKRETGRSVMPENLSETLGDQELPGLLRYLVEFASQKAERK